MCLDFQKAKLLHEGETAKAFKKEYFKEREISPDASLKKTAIHQKTRKFFLDLGSPSLRAIPMIDLMINPMTG